MGLIESRILTDQVYDTIKQMIQDGALRPGAKINKKELESLLGVSQTPINDALNRLAGQRFIEQRTRRGYYVRRYSCKEIIDLFAARGAVEGMATRLAVENASEWEITQLTELFTGFHPPLTQTEYTEYEKADREFHSSLIRLSGNDMIREMNEEFGYIGKAATKGLIRPPEETITEHRAIIGAIQTRNAKLAADLMVEHHMRTREVLIQTCKD